MGTKESPSEYGTLDRTKINFPYAKNFKNQEDSIAEHFKKHGKEFGFTNEKQYVKAAKHFANEITLGNVSYVDRLGKTYKYNTLTNEYAIISASGKVLTYYKPSDGERHYYEEKEKHAKN